MTEIQGRADSMMEEIKAREVGVNINNDIYCCWRRVYIVHCTK